MHFAIITIRHERTVEDDHPMYCFSLTDCTCIHQINVYHSLYPILYSFLNLGGTFESLVFSLTLPKTITHHPQIATTPFPTPTTLPNAPIVPVL